MFPVFPEDELSSDRNSCRGSDEKRRWGKTIEVFLVGARLIFFCKLNAENVMFALRSLYKILLRNILKEVYNFNIIHVCEKLMHM